MSDFSGKNILIVGGNVVMFSTVAVCIGLAFHASVAAAEFLLSNDSNWISGQVLSVDGGYSSLRLP